MSVFRVNKNKDYTVMSNKHLKDKNLSLKAKGLLSMMLSLPDDWDYSIEGLVSISKESKTSVKSTLDELKENDYLIVTKQYPNETQDGRIGYIYDIFEERQNVYNDSDSNGNKESEEKKQESKKQGIENLCLENLDVEIQGIENVLQLNTNNKILNNKILNTNKEVVEEYEKEIGLLTPFQFEKLNSYRDELTDEMIIEAIHRASSMNKKSLAYVEGILKSWISSGYKVIADIEDKPRGKHEETNEERMKRLLGDEYGH